MKPLNKPIPKSHLRQSENQMVALIWGRAKALGFGRLELARIMECSTATVNKRRLHPQNFTAGELIRLCVYLDIPPGEMAKAMTGGEKAC